MEEESIPVGGEPPACKPFVLQWPPLDVTSEGPQVNKFEQVSIVGHQMSVAGGEESSDKVIKETKFI